MRLKFSNGEHTITDGPFAETREVLGGFHLIDVPSLEEAIEAGGSTLRDFASPSGELGYFSKEWRVYGRESLPCPRCGTAIRRRASITPCRPTWRSAARERGRCRMLHEQHSALDVITKNAIAMMRLRFAQLTRAGMARAVGLANALHPPSLQRAPRTPVPG